MVVHFTIAIAYLAAFAGVVGLIWKGDGFFPKLFTLMLFFGIVATLAAGIAGVISESYLTHISPTVRHNFENHKFYGELTGVVLVAAALFQSWTLLRKRPVWTVSIIACLLSLTAAVTVSIAGHLGGMLVYLHGFGVHLGGGQ